jgi:hypothetical protein
MDDDVVKANRFYPASLAILAWTVTRLKSRPLLKLKAKSPADDDGVKRVKPESHGALIRSDARPCGTRAIARVLAFCHECLELMHRRGK